MHSQGIVEFAPGDQVKTFLVEAIKDSIPEYNENFVLQLTNVTGNAAWLTESLDQPKVGHDQTYLSIFWNGHVIEPEILASLSSVQ